jgi:hypothetical protein
MLSVPEQKLSATEASVRTIRTLRIAAVATIAAAAVTATLALPAHALLDPERTGVGTTLAAAEQDALHTLHGDFSGCEGPPIYFDEFYDAPYYYVTVAETCKSEN